MPLKIVPISINTQSNSDFTVSVAFWLEAPPNNIIPLPGFKAENSAVPHIDPTDLLAIQTGAIVEQPWTTGQYAAGTTLDIVQADLVSTYNDRQTNLTNSNPTVAGLLGTAYDGTNWLTTTPFSPVSADVQFSAHTQRAYAWTDWKAAFAVKGVGQQYNNNGVTYKIWFYDGPEVHLCVIWQGTVPNLVIQSGYSQVQNDADKADFLANFAPTANQSLQPKLPDGRLRTSSEKSTNTRNTIYSHNWTDKTTWYTSSAYIAGETATDDSTHLNYSLANQSVIDTYHGKLTGEDFLEDSSSRSYRPNVYVNSVKKTEQDPHYGTGGDYTIDYAGGVVHFLAANQPTDVVTVDYHYATNSLFIVAPAPGTDIVIDCAEVQFTLDAIITDTIIFQPYGIVDFFAPQLVGTGPGQIPSGTKIPLGNHTSFKTMMDFQNDASRSYPVYPAVGGSGWRGCTQPLVILDWDYQSSSVLYSAMGMEIHIQCQHDTPHGGTSSTATFYCITESAG